MIETGSRIGRSIPTRGGLYEDGEDDMEFVAGVVVGIIATIIFFVVMFIHNWRL